VHGVRCLSLDAPPPGRKKDFPTFPQLSFNKLKKTASSELRKIAGGEVAGLFLCHGRVVEDDLLEEYAARHFPPVHKLARKPSAGISSRHRGSSAVLPACSDCPELTGVPTALLPAVNHQALS
jgi:hypothetical protein